MANEEGPPKGQPQIDKKTISTIAAVVVAAILALGGAVSYVFNDDITPTVADKLFGFSKYLGVKFDARFKECEAKLIKMIQEHDKAVTDKLRRLPEDIDSAFTKTFFFVDGEPVGGASLFFHAKPGQPVELSISCTGNKCSETGFKLWVDNRPYMTSQRMPTVCGDMLRGHLDQVGGMLDFQRGSGDFHEVTIKALRLPQDSRIQVECLVLVKHKK